MAAGAALQQRRGGGRGSNPGDNAAHGSSGRAGSVSGPSPGGALRAAVLAVFSLLSLLILDARAGPALVAPIAGAHHAERWSAAWRLEAVVGASLAWALRRRGEGKLSWAAPGACTLLLAATMPLIKTIGWATSPMGSPGATAAALGGAVVGPIMGTLAFSGAHGLIQVSAAIPGSEASAAGRVLAVGAASTVAASLASDWGAIPAPTTCRTVVLLPLLAAGHANLAGLALYGGDGGGAAGRAMGGGAVPAKASAAVGALAAAAAGVAAWEGAMEREGGKLTPDRRYRVLSRGEGALGHVSVVEDQRLGLKVLKSGSSLLGGVYTGPGVEGESIYAAFYLQEAVRLATPAPASGGAPHTVLQIGLGIGVAAAGMQAAGARVDVIEVDPLVTRFAREHFELALEGNVWEEDAMAAVPRLCRDAPGSYSFVLHDVFSAGHLPRGLFSAAAFSEVACVLRPGGLVAVNLFGRAGGSTMRAAAAALAAAGLPFQRAVADEHPGEAMRNMVILAAREPFDLRPATEEDGYGSPTRAATLIDLPSRLVRGSEGWAKDGAGGGGGGLDTEAEELADEHWKVMRALFPHKSFWLETF